MTFTVCGPLPLPTVFLATWLTGISDTNHEDVRHLSSLYIFIFHVARSSVDHTVGGTENRERYAERVFAVRST